MGMWSMTFHSHRCSKRMKYGDYKIKYWGVEFQDYVFRFVRLQSRHRFSYAKDFDSHRNTNVSFPLCTELLCYDHETTAICLGNTTSHNITFLH